MNTIADSTSRDVYIYFALKDTGRGLDPDEISRLTDRFYQASPKTHIHVCCAGFHIRTQLTDISMVVRASDFTSQGGLRKCKEESLELLRNLVKGVSDINLQL